MNENPKAVGLRDFLFGVAVTLTMVLLSVAFVVHKYGVIV